MTLLRKRAGLLVTGSLALLMPLPALAVGPGARGGEALPAAPALAGAVGPADTLGEERAPAAPLAPTRSDMAGADAVRLQQSTIVAPCGDSVLALSDTVAANEGVLPQAAAPSDSLLAALSDTLALESGDIAQSPGASEAELLAALFTSIEALPDPSSVEPVARPVPSTSSQPAAGADPVMQAAPSTSLLAALSQTLTPDAAPVDINGFVPSGGPFDVQMERQPSGTGSSGDALLAALSETLSMEPAILVEPPVALPSTGLLAALSDRLSMEPAVLVEPPVALPSTGLLAALSEALTMDATQGGMTGFAAPGSPYDQQMQRKLQQAGAVAAPSTELLPALSATLTPDSAKVGESAVAAPSTGLLGALSDTLALDSAILGEPARAGRSSILTAFANAYASNVSRASGMVPATGDVPTR